MAGPADSSHPEQRPTANEALAWVRRGWDHLRRQSPLAAWASWRSAIRIAPGDPAAEQALAILAAADELPQAARATYRFRPPLNDEARSRWDARFRGKTLDDLEVAERAFADLAEGGAADGSALYNQALCLAWLGRNAEAIEVLGRVVALEAESRFDSAVEASMLAEVLRQGAGAEDQADDMSHSLTMDWDADIDGDPRSLLAEAAELRDVPVLLEPGSDRPRFADVQALEWLDRPMPAPGDLLTLDDLPSVLAGVVIAPGSIRFSSPDPVALSTVLKDVAVLLGIRPARRESTPLPFPLMDAAVWTFRIPAALDDQTRQRLTRDAVEHYLEQVWVQIPRHGLSGGREKRSPAQASRDASDGDAVARAGLTAVVRLREQLSVRPRTVALYAGYPFDRLRHRLGLEANNPLAVDEGDVSCMSREELSRLDPTGLDVAALTAALSSAKALGGDEPNQLREALARLRTGSK